MPPTLTWLDSFRHQDVAATFYGTNAGIYDTNNNIAGMSFVAGRRPGTFALQIVENGVAASRVLKNNAAGVRTLVESFYFKVSAAPSAASHMWVGVATANSTVGMDTTGHVYAICAFGTTRTSAGTYADGLWHRLDILLNTTANTYTLDVQVDGSALTQATGASTAGDCTGGHLGSTVAGHTLTVQFTDWVRSVTSGDYPIGAHAVGALVPDADGTHSWASTNMGNESGGLTSAASTLHNSVDEYPANLTDYVAYTNLVATAAEYAEITLPDVPAGAAVWGARAVAAIFSAGTSANAATTRIVDGSGATVLNLYVGDQSDTALRHQAGLIPSITSDTLLNALKYRVGFPTDSNPAPRWSALLIDYAGPDPTIVDVTTAGAVTFAGQAVTVGPVVSVTTAGQITFTGQTVTAAGGGGGPTTVNVSTAGAITFAGQAVGVVSVAPVSTAGAITFAGQSVPLRGTITPTAGAVTFTGQSVGVVSTALVGTAGAVLFTGQALPLKITVAVGTAGAVLFTGQAVSFGGATTVNVDTAGAVLFTGQALPLKITVAPTAGAVAFTGQASPLRVSVAVGTAGAITFAGQGVGTVVAVPVSAGALTMAGQAQAFRILAALTAGQMTFTGQAVTAGQPAAPVTAIDFDAGVDGRDAGASRLTAESAAATVTGGLSSRATGGE